MIPELLKVVSECEQLCTLIRRDLRCRKRGFFEAALHLGNMGQSVVPSLLELCGDEAVLRLRRLILPLDTSSLITSLLQCEFERTSLFIGLALAAIQRIEGRLYADRT